MLAPSITLKDRVPGPAALEVRTLIFITNEKGVTSMGALMKSRKGSLVLVCLLVVLLLLPGYADLADSAAEFAGGSGTEDDPFLIATAQQLARLSSCLDAHFRLMADIDLNVAPYNRGKGWKPIGSMDEPFTGSFDGNGRTIRGLYINREDEDYIGLFGLTVEGSALRNIRLEEVKIRGRNYVGGLGGLIYDGSIDDCYVSGTVRGEKDTGGLVGLASCTIRNCYTNCTVGGADNVGGIAGSNWGTLTGSYAAGQVTGREAVGGLVGCNEWFVEDTYARGTVRGREQVGDLVGFNHEGHIYNSYATGTVQGDRDTGGLVGFSDEKGIVFNSYYDRETTGQDDTGKGEPRTTAEMLHRSAYPKWDFAATWVIVDGTSYPMLRWQEEAPRLGFRASLPRGSVQPGVEFQLELTDHKGESGALLTGSRMVTVQREGEEDFLFQSVVDFISGEARVPLTLSTPGSYTLRVYVEDVPYSELITADVVNPEYAGGIGTVDDPYLIANARHLDNVRYNLNACYKLISDIDLAVAPYNEGDGWKPIGCQERPFTGFFDGNGKTIRGLYIMQERGDEIGLFGYLGEGAALYNIQLAEVNVTGRTLVGGLVGYNEGGSIAAAGVTGTVAGFSDTGGLAGKNQGFIKECYTNCNVDGRTVDIGGLVGDNYGEVVASSAAGAVTGTHSVGGLLGYHGGRAADCYALGDVKGDLYTGGLAGIVDEQGTLSNSYAAGPVTGNHMAGGFVGANMGRVATCYATGDVTCEKGAGGFVGYNYLGEITPSYAAGAVTGSDMIGGFVGLNEGAITASYAAGAVRGDGYVGGFAGEKIPNSCSRQLIDTETKF